MKKLTILIALLIYLCLVTKTSADNPVLCKLHQVIGEWEFVFDSRPVRKRDFQHSTDSNVWYRPSGGRGQPTHIQGLNLDDEEPQLIQIAELQNGPDSNEDQASVIRTRFVLTDNGNLIYQSGDVAEGHEGAWTLVVHEGFQAFVNADLGFYDGMIALDTFWRYNQVDRDVFESDGTQTILGWYHTMASNRDENDDELWGCFYGRRLLEESENEEPIIFEDGAPVFETDRSAQQGSNEQLELAQDGESSWDTNSNRAASSSRELASHSPTLEASSAVSSDDVNRNVEGRLSELGDLLQFVGRDPECLATEDLPENFNWNNINGYSFFSKIRNQAGGDCFLVAAQSVVESRIRIMSNGRINPTVSNQHQKDCNFYTEGCDGGLPINIAKWGWEFGLLDEQGYSSSSHSSHERGDYEAINTCESRYKYFVDDYYYVGNNYGGITEEAMMREVLTHGPVTVVLDVPAYLSSYNSGVLIEECPVPEDQISEYLREGPNSPRLQMKFKSNSKHQINTKSLWDRGIEWEMVNHSVVLVGWGIATNPDEIPDRDITSGNDCQAANDGAFWIIANSWGENFGESGFMRIRRGCNDFAVETQALSIMPLFNESDIDSDYLNNSRMTC